MWVTQLPGSASAPDAMWDPHMGQKEQGGAGNKDILMMLGLVRAPI